MTQQRDFFLMPGDRVEFSKTVGESDVYLFAGITGDLSPNHVNEQFMSRTKYKRRIAHGALLVGYMSAASTRMLEKTAVPDAKESPVTIGYDHIRYLGAVFIGDTITVRYEVKEIDKQRRRSLAAISIINQDGKEVAVAQHTMKWLPNEG
jgi:acyl dehydratase